MKYTLLLFVILLHSAFAFAHIKFSEAERTIIRLQDERRGIDTIASYLDSKEGKVVWRAAIALANIGDTSARPVLIRRLSKEIRPKAVEGIVFALGVLGTDRHSFDALKKVASREASNELFIALGRTVPKDATGELLEIINLEKATPMHTACALVEIGLQKKMTEDLAKKVDELESNNNPDVRWRAIYSFARTEDSALLNNHLSSIKDYLSDVGSPESRMFAATALGRIHNEAAGKMLLDAARSESEWRVRVNIMNAIGKMPRFSSAIYGALKKAVEESNPDSLTTNHIATAALDVLDAMITAGKLTSPDSVTVGEWLSEYYPSSEKHSDETNTIRSQAMIPLARLSGAVALEPISYYLATHIKNLYINGYAAIGVIADTFAVRDLMMRLLKEMLTSPSEVYYAIGALHSLWEISKKEPAFRHQLGLYANAYRHLVIRAAGTNDDQAVVAAVMDQIKDPTIVTDSLRQEAEEYLLQYLDKFSHRRQYRTQLIAVLSAVSWLAPKNDTFKTKLHAIYKDAAEVWRDQQLADSAYTALRSVGEQLPKAKVIFDPIDWNQIERMPDTLLVQSKYDLFYIKLNTYETPLSALNMYKLSKMNYFAGSYIHRVVPNFVVQLGDPTGTGEGGPDYAIRTEIAPVRYDNLGACGMASSGKDTEGSQWFMTHCPTPHLNTRYTIWGEVAIGKERIEKFLLNDQIDNLIPYR